MTQCAPGLFLCHLIMSNFSATLCAMTEKDYKLKFAAQVAKGDPPIVAADTALRGTDVDQAFVIRMAKLWANDSEVIVEIDRLKNKIPDSNEIAIDLWNAAQAAKQRGDYKEYNAIMRTLSECQGLIGPNAKKGDAETARDRLDALKEMLNG